MKVFKIIISKMIGLMIFLILLYLINRFRLEMYGYETVVNFINANAVLLIVMSLLFMIAEVIFALTFPFNLPAPIFSAFTSLLLVKFIFRIFGLLGELIAVNFLSIFNPFIFIVYPVVFIAVFIGGYISIFTKKKGKKKGKSNCREFKKAFSDFFRKLADSIDKK